MIEHGLSESALYIPKSHLICERTESDEGRKLSVVNGSPPNSPASISPVMRDSQESLKDQSNDASKKILSEVEAVLQSDFWNSKPNLDEVDNNNCHEVLSSEPIETPSVEEPISSNTLSQSKGSLGGGINWMRDKLLARGQSFKGRAKTLSPRASPPKGFRDFQRNLSANSLTRMNSWDFPVDK